MIWPSKVWAEAIWASNFKPAEKLVALAYADHARDKRQAWLSYQRLVQRTGYSRSSCAAAVRVLREAGWLRVVDKGRQHHSTVYELTTPRNHRTNRTTKSVHSMARLANGRETPGARQHTMCGAT